ncbi:MAG: hypothetical protein ACRDHY_17200 [Anaerolineales bacterium]
MLDGNRVAIGKDQVLKLLARVIADALWKGAEKGAQASPVTEGESSPQNAEARRVLDGEKSQDSRDDGGGV